MPVNSNIVLPKGASLIEEDDAELVLPKGAMLVNDKKKVKVGGGDSLTGTENISPSESPLTSEEVAKGVFSFGQFRDKKTSLPANIPRTEKNVQKALKAVHFGIVNQQQLSDLYNDPNTKEVASNIIKQYAPEATEESIGNPSIIESAAKKIKQDNRINYVNAEKESIVVLDGGVVSELSEYTKGIPANKAGRLTDYINELRSAVSVDDFTNNDKISSAIEKIKKIESLEQKYFLSPEERKESIEKNQALLRSLNDRLSYNISRTGPSKTINHLDNEINQAVISKVMEAERGEEPNPEESGKDNIKVSQFKLGLSAIEKSDPVLFKNVINGIFKRQKVSDTDFSNIARIGQHIDNQIRFRGGAYDPSLIDTETSFDYDTFGQKKASAAVQIGEWLKSKGNKNQNEFSEKQIRQAAKEVGVDNEEIINSLIFEEKLGGYDAIPKSGWIDDISRGIMQPLEGINSTISSWSESPVDTYLRSKELSGTFGSQNVSDKEGQYSDILPSERGKFTTDMFRGLGQFIPQVLLTKGVGATLRTGIGLAGVPLAGSKAKNVADFGGTFISTFLQSYGPSYEEHLQKTGDANTAALIGVIDGTSSAAFELLLPDVKLADKAFSGLKKSLATDLVSLIKKGGDPADLAIKARPFVQKFFTQAAGNILQETAEEVGTQYVDFVTESIFDPASAKDRNLNKELWDTFKSTTAAMLLPSIMGATGGSFTKDFTTKSLHSAAINLDSYKESLQNSLDKEYISQDDYNKSIKILETHKQSIENTPNINANGVELSPEKKLDYALEDTKIKVYKANANKTEGVAKEMWEAKIKQAEDIQRNILMPKEVVAGELVTEENKNITPAANISVNEEGLMTEGNIKTSAEIENNLISELGEERSLEAKKQVAELVENDLIPQEAIASSQQDIQNNPISFLKFVAEQAQGSFEFEGKTVSSRDQTIEKYGEGIVAAAEDFFPNIKTSENVNQEAEIAPETKAEETGLLSQEGAAETQKKAAPYVSKFPKPSKPFSQLSSSELKEYSQNVKTYQKKQEVEFFGKEGAKRYKEAIRTSNSATATREEVEAANAIVDEMESSLSSEQKDDFFGINQAPGVYDPEEISKVAAQVGLIEQSENIQDLSKSLKNPLLSLSKDVNDEGSLATLNAAKKRGEELGIDPTELIKKSIENIASDLPDKSDASFLSKSILERLVQPEEKPSPKQVESSQSKNETKKFERKELSDQLRKLLGNEASPLVGSTNPSNRLSFKDVGFEKGDTIEQAIEKAIAHGSELSELFKIIQGDPNLKNVTLEFVDSLPDGEMGLYHPVGHGEGKDGLLQVADQANVIYSLAHELTHFLTLDSKAAEDVKDSAGYKGIEELYNYVAAKKGKPVAGSATLENYGLTNVKEFMAEMFINPTFRRYVSDVFAENKEDILKTNKFLRDSKVSSIGDMIANFFRDLFNKIFASGKESVEIDVSKPVIDNAVKLATELFLGGQDVTSGQMDSEQPSIPLAGRNDSKAAALGLPGTDKDKVIKDFIKTSFINRASEQDIIGALIDNGFTEEYAKSIVEENRLSGIKKSLVSPSVIDGVDLDDIGDKEMMALGKKLLDSGEVKAESIVNRIVREGSGVLEPKEVVALIRYKADLDNSLRDAYKEKNRLVDRGDDLGTVTEEINNLEERKDAYEIMSVITAQQQSMAFRLRKMLLDREYNVTTQIERYKANNNGFISPEVEARFREMDAQLREVKAQLAEAEQRAQDAEANESIRNIKEDIERKNEYTEDEINQKVQEGITKEIAKIYEQLPVAKKSVADKAIAALESFQKKLRSRAYDAGLGVPVAVIDAGVTTIKNAIKAGVAISNAIELGIDKIKSLYGQVWDKENDFRKDMMAGFKEAGFDTKKPKNEKPYINDKGKLKIPEKFLRELVKRGVTDINDLSQQVLDEIKSEIPDLTIRQVRDAITDYGKQVNPTADEIKKQILTARRIGRLLSQLEDLQEKKRKPINPSTKAKLTDEEVRLKRQIVALQHQIPQTDEEAEAENERKLETTKTATKRRIAELEQKLKNKDFSKPKPKKIIEDTELTNLNAEKERIQNEFDKEQYKNELKNRTGWQKAGDIALELISALPRALVASIDFSAVLVQGVVRFLTRPGQSARAMGDMFKQFASEKVQQDWENKIKAQSWYPTLEASKVQLTEVGGKLSAREELFIGDWINHIWNGIGRVVGLASKRGQDFFVKLNPYKATNRAYVGYLNSIRVQAFLEGMKFIDKRGMTFESNPEVFKAWGDYVNNSTGRGTLGGLERSAKAMSIVFFAPRKIAATIKLLSPYSIVHYWKMPALIRQKAILNFASFLAMSTTMSILGKAIVKKRCGDKDDINFWDSNSSDFLTIRCGETRLDFFGGYKQQVVLMSRLATGEFTDANGNVTKLGDRYGKQINTEFDAIEQYFANKLSPLASLAKRKLDERKGLELDPEEEALKGILPIWIQDVGSLYKDHPTEMGIMLNILSIFGAGIQNYSSSSKKSSYTQEDLKDPVFKFFADKKVPLPESKPNLIEIEDEETSTLKKLDEYGEARVGEFNDVRKEKLKEELELIQNDGFVYVDQYGRVSTTDEEGDKDIIELDKLNAAQLKTLLSIAGAKATKAAKKELFDSD